MTTLEKNDKEYLNKGNSYDYKYSRDPSKTTIKKIDIIHQEYAALVISKIRDVDSKTKLFCKGFINLMLSLIHI